MQHFSFRVQVPLMASHTFAIGILISDMGIVDVKVILLRTHNTSAVHDIDLGTVYELFRDGSNMNNVSMLGLGHNLGFAVTQDIPQRDRGGIARGWGLEYDGRDDLSGIPRREG